MLQVTSTNISIKKLLNNVIAGDAYDLLGLIPDESVDLIITSSPYWGRLEHNWKLLNDIGRVREIGNKTLGYDWYRAQGGILGLEPYPEDEFTFRLNDGDVKRHTLERLASLVSASFGPHITYRELTA